MFSYNRMCSLTFARTRRRLKVEERQCADRMCLAARIPGSFCPVRLACCQSACDAKACPTFTYTYKDTYKDTYKATYKDTYKDTYNDACL